MSRNDLERERHADALRFGLDAAMLLLIGLAMYVLHFRVLLIVIILAVLCTGYSHPPTSRCTRIAMHIVTPLVLGILTIELYISFHDRDAALAKALSRYTGLSPRELVGRFQMDWGSKAQFYLSIGTLFALLVGLALLKGIDAVGRIKENHSGEVRDIRTAWWCTEYFEDHELETADMTRAKGDDSVSAKYGLRANLLSYLANVGKETGSATQGQSNDELLKALQSNVRDMHPADDDDRIARQEIVRVLDRIGAARTRRLSVRGDAPPAYMMFALWLMSLAIVLPFLAEPLCKQPPQQEAGQVLAGQRAASGPTDVSGPGARSSQAAAHRITCDAGLVPGDGRFGQYYMIFVLVAFFSFLLLMLHDLGDTRDGFWRVDTGEYGELREELAAEAARSAERSSTPSGQTRR